MEFFSFANFGTININANGYPQYTPTNISAQIIWGLIGFLIVYTFKCIALYKIAVREGYTRKWMAFVPFISTYYIGYCSKKNRFFKISTDKFALIVMAVEIVYFAMSLFSFIATCMLAEYLTLDRVEEGLWSEGLWSVYSYTDLPLEKEWLCNFANNVVNQDSSIWYVYRTFFDIFNIGYIILLYILMNCFFRTYGGFRYQAKSLLSAIFPIQGILMFWVCKYSSKNYIQFVREEQEKMYRMRQQMYRNNPANGGSNPYSDVYGEKKSSPSPFDDFPDITSDNASNGQNKNQKTDYSPFDDF